MNIQQYMRDIAPFSVLDIMDSETLINTLNGFSVALNCGITFIYPKSFPITPSTLGRLDTNGKASRVSSNPLCAVWRGPDQLNCNTTCVEADYNEAMKYFNGEWEGPRLYRCQPLGLWDLTFPIYVGENIVGILIAGQLIVKNEGKSWGEILDRFPNIVDRATFLEDDHVNSVLQRITRIPSVMEKFKDREYRDLYDYVHDHAISFDDFIKWVCEVINFGALLKGMINDLYKAKKGASEQLFLSEISSNLATIKANDIIRWWDSCLDYLKDVLPYMHINHVDIYIRYRAHFHLETSWPHSENCPSRIPVRNVVKSVPDKRITYLYDKRIGVVFSSRGGLKWGYRSVTGSGSEENSIFIIIEGFIPDYWLSTTELLCKMLCSSADIVSYIYRLRSTHADYQKNVNDIGHNIRVPLMNINYLLNEIDIGIPNVEYPLIHEKIKQGKTAIKRAREDLLHLLERNQQEEVFNLVEIFNQVISIMEPTAEEHKCVIVKNGDWPDRVLISGLQYRIKSALICLMDNAIKYSFYGPRQGLDTLFEVRSKLLVKDQYVECSITNYGIGIPPEMIKSFGDYGIRGNVHDPKMKRLGTGRGLPYAMEVFNQAGGWLEITSTPSQRATDEEKSKYHRYITRVDVFLPILPSH